LFFDEVTFSLKIRRNPGPRHFTALAVTPL
jgi:hypothetical protein